MRKTLSIILFVVLFAAPCWGTEAEINVSAERGEASEAAQAIANVTLAEQIAELGRAQRSPLLLASAAQILNSAGTFAEEQREKAETEGEAEGDKAAPARAVNTPESLYAEAIAAAKDQGDAALTAILESQARVGGTRGLVGGARVHNDRVIGRDVYNLQFHGERQAVIQLLGDGDDIEIYIFDSNGNFITSDANGISTVRHVTWTPRWTGDFRVVIVNPSDRVPYVDYRITTN